MAPDGNGGRAQKSVADDVLDKLKEIVGPKGWSQDADTLAPLLVDTRGYYHGATAILVRPETTEQVAAIMKTCHAAGVPVVPQGGNTSRVGSATPDESGGSVLLSLAKMNTIREVDPVDYTMTVEAGGYTPGSLPFGIDADSAIALALTMNALRVRGQLHHFWDAVPRERRDDIRRAIRAVFNPDSDVWRAMVHASTNALQDRLHPPG